MLREAEQHLSKHFKLIYLTFRDYNKIKLTVESQRHVLTHLFSWSQKYLNNTKQEPVEVITEELRVESEVIPK